MQRDIVLPIRSANRIGLDKRLAGLRGQIGPPPPRGWIRTVREALGISLYELGRRMGVTASNVRQLERAEETGTLRLRSLERAAEALNCRLCYVLVPDEPLQQMARRQAHDKAARMVAARARAAPADGAEQDPALLAATFAEEVEALAHELLNRRDLWDTERTGWRADTRSEPS